MIMSFDDCRDAKTCVPEGKAGNQEVLAEEINRKEKLLQGMQQLLRNQLHL